MLLRHNVTFQLISFSSNQVKQQASDVYPRNFAPTGPISRIRLAIASPSMSGGGFNIFSILSSLHVTLVGIHALPGGMIIRTPECRQPCIAPPRASTMKLTRKLKESENMSFVVKPSIDMELEPAPKED